MQQALGVPTFRPARMRAIGVPPGGIFVSCTDGARRLCAFRHNSSAMRVHILKDRRVVNTLEDADDPRVFTHGGVHWVLNNNYYRMTMVELHGNGTFGRQLRFPIKASKNLVPISWSDTHFFVLDLQERHIWPATLGDAHTVLVELPLKLTLVQNRGKCALPAGCALRGGSQGVHLRPTDDHGYGMGHCTSVVRRRGSVVGVAHAAYWWALNLRTKRAVVEGICTGKRKLVDPTALYPTVKRGFSASTNRTWERISWVLSTAEADEQWNRRANQTYYNRLYRGESLQRALPVVKARKARPSGATSSTPVGTSLRVAAREALRWLG